MTSSQTVLKALLRQRHLQEHRAFCREFSRVAKMIDPELAKRYPSKASFYRWLSGDLHGLPYPGACRVLEKMLPGWTAAELFEPWNAEEPPERPVHHQAATGGNQQMSNGPAQLADLTAAFASRADYAHELPPHVLLDQATTVRAAGLSLNMLCQQYPDQKLQALLERGGNVQTLFLDPNGEQIKAREEEEELSSGHLSTLTELNIQVLGRLRSRLSADAANRLEIRTYDETVRFNITIVNEETCIVQPYLPHVRGVDSPTLAMRRKPDGVGLYPVFDQVFQSLWEKGKAL